MIPYFLIACKEFEHSIAPVNMIGPFKNDLMLTHGSSEKNASFNLFFSLFQSFKEMDQMHNGTTLIAIFHDIK